MPTTGLYRNYHNLTVLTWLGDNEFLGTVERMGETIACYGWSKGRCFWVYKIIDGHIQKLGSLDREVLDSQRQTVVD